VSGVYLPGGWSYYPYMRYELSLHKSDHALNHLVGTSVLKVNLKGAES